MNIAITGVTGKMGGQVAALLDEAGFYGRKDVRVRHIARSPERAKSYHHVDIVKASYENTSQTVDALKGVDVLFMVSAKESKERLQQHLDFVDAALEAGVKHIIYLSFYGAKANCTFTLGRTHFKTEEYIKEKGFLYTFLRDNFYMDFFVDLCKIYGEIKGSAGNGKVSAVVRSDVAEVVAKILQEPQKWENQTLQMTGPENLSMKEVIETVGAFLGKEIVYIDETVEEAYASRQVYNAEQWEYDSWVSTYTAIAKGEQEGISSDIEKVLGRPATSLKVFLTQ